MRDKILEDLKMAMKSQDKETLAVIRMVKGAMQLEELNKKKQLDDDEMVALIAKQIKMRKESIVEYEKGNRKDLVDKTNNEIEILNRYMPEQLTNEELMAIIDEAFKTLMPTSTKDMGKIIGFISPKVKGKADMGEVSKIIKGRLN